MILWGTLGVFVLWSGLAAIDVAFYRCLIGALLMGCWFIKSTSPLKLDASTKIVALAGVFLIMNWIFLFKSFQVSSITIGNISYYLQPIILIILGIFIYREKVNFRKWMLIMLALAGVILTIDPRNLYSPNIILGVFLALIAAFFYSFVTILMKHNQQKYFNIIFIQLSIGVLILLPFVDFQSISVMTLVCLSIIGVFHTLLAYYLYYKALKKTNYTQIAVLSYLDPIVAIISDVLFFNRHLSLYQMIGIFLTFSALCILVMSTRTEVKLPEAA